MSPELLYYSCAVLAVVVAGLAKGGFAGVGSLAMPIMALGVDPVRGAAILLPILIVQDAVGVWAYRRTWDGAILKAILPGAAVGIGLGYAFAAQVSETAVLGALGAISILFGLQRLWIERSKDSAVMPSNSPAWVGFLFGIASGFTSQIAHAGSPPFQMWVLPKRLSRDMLVGTTAFAFAAARERLRAEAAAMVAWFAGREPKDDFEANVKAVLASDTIKVDARHLAIAAAAVPTYQRHQSAAQQLPMFA